jgi:C-terminal processing protease CtpA/Prc
MMNRWIKLGWVCGFALALSGRGDAPVKFEEVFGLVRSNLTGVSESELSRAAALGLIEKLQGKVELTDAATANASSVVAKTNVLDGAFAYVRLNRTAAGAAQQISDFVKANKGLKGIILDLRFAGGDDYAAVGDVVNLFVGNERSILKFGDKTAKTAPRAEVIELPLAALINRQTTGSAEALAAALRDQQLALLIGGRTAGQVLVFDDFPLSSGQHLKIARAKVELPDGKTMGSDGLQPDIAVDADEKNERRWLEDPYLAISKPGAPAGAAPFLTSVTNRVARRPNASEVARRHRLELDEDDRPEVIRPEPAARIVQDAALARALDFLKGVSAVPRLRQK